MKYLKYLFAEKKVFGYYYFISIYIVHWNSAFMFLYSSISVSSNFIIFLSIFYIVLISFFYNFLNYNFLRSNQSKFLFKVSFWSKFIASKVNFQNSFLKTSSYLALISSLWNIFQSFYFFKNIKIVSYNYNKTVFIVL